MILGELSPMTGSYFGPMNYIESLLDKRRVTNRLTVRSMNVNPTVDSEIFART